MKLLTYRFNREEAVGVLASDHSVCPIEMLGIDCATMNELIETMDEKKWALLQKGAVMSSLLPLEEVELLAPIPHPKQDVLCLGFNYAEHAEESARYKKDAFGGEHPVAVYFSKRVAEALAPGGTIDSHKDIVEKLDYEVELAAIIGKDAYRVAKEEARDYIFGYTILNDVSAREIQTQHKQWYFGKSLDTFTPMGPWIVTADEFDFPPALRIQSKVNGELRQNSTTDMLIFDLPHVLHELSSGITLKAGTIIATGTPAGVGMGFSPPRFLKPGDTIACSIEKIGTLTNTIL